MQLDLEVIDVAKRYGARRAVDDLSFTVECGSFFSIVGPAGCGKTTLLQLIAGTASADGGEIRIGGRSIEGLSARQHPAHLVQAQRGRFPLTTVGGHLANSLSRLRLPRDEIATRIAAALERVGLGGVQSWRLSQLSSDQAQRVAMGLGLLLDPTLLLLDDPLAALEGSLRAPMAIELKQWQAAFGITMIHATRDAALALLLSDQVVVMNDGTFEQIGSPQRLYHEPQTPFVAGFVGINNRIAGHATGVSGDAVELVTAAGLYLFARRFGPVQPGDAVEAFVRPEHLQIARGAAALPADQPMYAARVESLLFEGASSAVLLREAATDLPLRVALAPGSAFSDLRIGEVVAFGFDPQRAICFAVSGLPGGAAAVSPRAS